MISGRKEVLDLTIQPAMGFWKIPIQGDWKTRFSTDMIIIRMLVQAEGSQNLLEPRTWWEAKKAKEATVLAIVGWAILLVILIMIVLIGGPQNP